MHTGYVELRVELRFHLLCVVCTHSVYPLCIHSVYVYLYAHIFCLLCVLCSVYSGHQSILIPPSELEVNPALWLLAVSQYKVRDTFCSYSVMELCTKGLGLQTESLKVGVHPPNHHNNETSI